MSGVAKAIFGGDDSAKREAERSQQLQQVANDRQLAEQNRNSTAIGASRRAPRGRRLFEDGSEAMPKVLG